MKKIAVWLGAPVILLSMVSIAAAQATDGGVEQAQGSTAGSSTQQQQGREFGTTAISILQIGAAHFRPRFPAATLTYQFSGLVQANTAGYQYWAPVNLPAGARVSWIDLYACDTNATNHIRATLTGYSGWDIPATADLFTVTSAQTAGSGCSYWSTWILPNYTINNDVRYDGGNHYVINLSFGAADATNQFKGVDLWWQRQVSPAPVSASFGDVPTGHWAFQFVEALKASGITTGCAAGVYCPDNNVTRAEMAVFLSRALGLHWQH